MRDKIRYTLISLLLLPLLPVLWFFDREIEKADQSMRDGDINCE